MNTQTRAATAFAATSTIVVVLANDPVAFAKASRRTVNMKRANCQQAENGFNSNTEH
jgi:hypothetical protein